MVDEHVRDERLTIAVVGAGIAGLSAAWDLQRAGHTVTVYDRNGFPGGRMADVVVDGICTHSGASIIFSFNKEMLSLIEALGLSDEVQSLGDGVEVTCNDGGTDYPLRLAPSVPFLLTHKALGLATKAKLTRLLPDLIRSGLTTDPCLMHTAVAFDDEGMPDYVRRVVSEEFLEKYLEPLFRAPWHWEPEDIGKAYLMSLMGHLATADEMTFRRGIGQLTRTLAERLDVRLETTVHRVTPRAGGGATLDLGTADGRQTIEANVVVMAVEGVHAAGLVEGLTAEERAFFGSVRYNPGARIYYGLKHRNVENVRNWYTRSSPSLVSLYHVLDEDDIVPEGHVQPATIQAELIPALIARVAEEGGQGRLDSYVRDQIRAYYPAIDEDVAAIAPQWWDAMLPQWPQGYATRVAAFLSAQEAAPRDVYFCGDYLSQSHTGGACASGRRTASLLMKHRAERSAF